MYTCVHVPSGTSPPSQLFDNLNNLRLSNKVATAPLHGSSEPSIALRFPRRAPRAQHLVAPHTRPSASPHKYPSTKPKGSEKTAYIFGIFGMFTPPIPSAPNANAGSPADSPPASTQAKALCAPASPREPSTRSTPSGETGWFVPSPPITDPKVDSADSRTAFLCLRH